MEVTFATTAFAPVVLGFFGLGTGYLIYGPPELFGFPGRDASVDRASGIWSIWMPGFLQFVTRRLPVRRPDLAGVAEATHPLRRSTGFFRLRHPLVRDWMESLSGQRRTSDRTHVDRVVLGFARIATGLWLMYLTFATTLDICLHYTLPGA